MLASRVPVRASILQLPPHLRVNAYQKTASRSFSAHAFFEGGLVEVLATPSAAILSGLHAAGIPWYATIPLAATLVRGIFGHYIGGIPAQRRAQARNNILPLVTAQMNEEFRERENRGEYKTPREIMFRKPLQMFWSRVYRLQTVGGRFGGALISPSTFLNFFGLIATAEALRMKCGSRAGLLSLIASPLNRVGHAILPGMFPAPIDPTQEAGEKFAARIEEIRQARLEQAQLPGGTENALAPGDIQTIMKEAGAPTYQVDTSGPQFEPSLQTEGLPWIPDLTLPDPTAILPFGLLVIMAGRIMLQPRKKALKPGWAISLPLRWFDAKYSALQKLGVFLSYFFFLIATQMPAGIILYLTSSVLVGMVQTRWLNRRMPLRPAIMACKRPTRLKAKKLWADNR